MKLVKKIIQISQGNPLKLVNLFLNKKSGIVGFCTREKYNSLDVLLENHFNNYSDPSHPCRNTLSKSLEMLGGRPAKIIETGSAAWGVNSSILFDSYVNSFGGSFFTVDIRINPMTNLLRICTDRSKFYCDDSINFLKKFPKSGVSLIYLDSWDVSWSDPLPSALHGFSEFIEILPFLTPGSLLLIDDTPKDSAVMERVHSDHVNSFIAFQKAYGFAPGKGALVLNYLKQFSIGEILSHDYQLLVKF